MEELEPIQTSPVDPSVNSHRPAASGKSQDISHILASVFNDVYTGDISGGYTLSNLVKTKTTRGSREDHQQTLSEYEQHIKEADMLENHIIQARARAAEKERQDYEKMKIVASDYEELITVKAAFPWYVDGDLLKRHNLISPEDYFSTQKPQIQSPAAVKPSFANPTISSAMRTSWEPQPDWHTPIPSPKRNVSDDSLSLTCEFSSESQERSETPKEKLNQTKPKPKWMGEPSAKDRAEESERLLKLKDRRNYLRNPRFLPPNAHEGGSCLIRARAKNKHNHKGSEDQSSSDGPPPVFLAKPPVIVFTSYIVGQVYESTLELINTTSTSRHVRVIPPTTKYFSIGLGRFPGEGGIVAPGMSCKYTLRFAPDSLGDFKDFIVVETQAKHLLTVPIKAQRPPPILTLPRVLDCGYCLVGGVKFVKFQCENLGFNSGTFCIIPKDQWPTSNLRAVTRKHFSEQPPFAVSPSLFTLQSGENISVEAVFIPTVAERSSQTFTIVCDNCQVKYISIEGEGQLVALELVSVSGEEGALEDGEIHDITAEHFVHFSPCNPHSKQQKILVIRNYVHLELPFFWQTMKPNMPPLLPGETPESSHIRFNPTTDDVFHISPTTGLLAPCQDHEFLLTFSPKEIKDYHSVLHLNLMDVPQLPPEPRETSILQPVQAGSRLVSVTAMEIEVKGSTEPYQVLLEPDAVKIPGDILICTTTHEHFKMWNHSKTLISFQWERLQNNFHKIEVEPSAGEIEENNCFDFDLILMGGKPEKVETSLVCNIKHHHTPVTLAVEVTFKGPTVTVGVPSLDFGLVRLGEQTQTAMTLTNTNQLEASWTLEEKLHQDHQEAQVSVQPCRGVLPPLASCDVDVVFRPCVCQQFETELELNVENGTGCLVLVRADVQSPPVCLLPRKLVLSEINAGIPANGNAKLQGPGASLCAASFDPPAGILGPSETMEIRDSFTSLSDLELTEVTAVCDVQEMNSPHVLSIVASKPKKRCVSYSLPGACPSQDDHDPTTLVLDFGEEVVLKRAVTKQLLITNHTAVPAPFTIEAEYFSCQLSVPNNQSEKRFIHVKNPLHSLQAKKEKEKAHKEFISSLLAHGKGAAFHVQPDSGLLAPFETQTMDVTAYTDMWGEYRDRLICKVGDLDLVRIPVQMTVKGCPLYFQMTGPRVDDQHQGPIIRFGTHMSGGDTDSRSLRINNPTKSDIRVDWETYNIDQSDGQLVDVVVSYGDHFPLKDADGNAVLSGVFRLPDRNVPTASQRTHTTASDGSMNDVEEEESESVDAKKNLISVSIRPHLGNPSDYPYCITPQQIVIPAESSGTIHVTFTPLTLSGSDCESRCSGLALGFMSLDSEKAVCVQGKVRRASGLDLEPIRLDLQAVVKHAVLSVLMGDDGGVLEFNASASDLLRAGFNEKLVVQKFAVTQTFQLVNAVEMPLHFRLGTQPPFSVLKPQPRLRTSNPSKPSTGNSQTLVLQPGHAMRVEVAFHCSLPLLDHTDQTDEDTSPGVKLIYTENGQKKLRFLQNVLIQYSNNSLQTVPLCAHLDLPALSLSSDWVNFGFCYVGQTQTREINLYNQGAHTDWKSVTEPGEGGPHVFRVTPDFGLLRSKTPHMTAFSQPLQISFTPSEDREFKAVVVIQSTLVKTPLTLQLQGTGSFEKEYRSKYLS